MTPNAGSATMVLSRPRGQPVTSAIASSLGLPRPGGVLIKEVYPDGPLGRAGVKSGEVVQSVDGVAVDVGLKPGKPTPLTIKVRDVNKVASVSPAASPPRSPITVTHVKIAVRVRHVLRFRPKWSPTCCRKLVSNAF